MSNIVFPKKILIAVRPIDMQTVSSVLGSEFELAVCHTLEEAMEHLNEEIALVVCGIRFDQGSMFELLSAARAHLHTASIPCYLIVDEDIKYSASIMEAIRKAAALKGATGFIELANLISEFGREQAYRRTKEAVRGLLEASCNQRTIAAEPRATLHVPKSLQ